MKTRTKISALLLAILMIVAVLPISVSAADLPTSYDSPDGMVASLTLTTGTKYYATFKDAWLAAGHSDNADYNANAVITLLTNGDAYPGGSDGLVLKDSSHPECLTVDLNGYVLNNTTQYRTFQIRDGYTLIIKDSNPTAVHKYTKDETTGLYTWDETNGNIEISGGTITGGYTASGANKSTMGAAVLIHGGTLIIEGGNFIGNSALNGGSVIRAQKGDSASPVLQINGGLFLGNTSYATAHNNVNYTGRTEVIYGTDLSASSYVKGGVFAGKILVKTNTTSAGVSVAGDDVSSDYMTGDYAAVSLTMYGEELRVVTDTASVQFLGVQRTEAVSGTYSLRLIAQVKKSLIDDAATSAAFNIAVGSGTANAHAVSSYYTSLTAQGENGEAVAITPDANYVLLAVIIKNIPVTSDSKLTVGVSLTNPSISTAKNVEIQLVANGNPTVAYVTSAS